MGIVSLVWLAFSAQCLIGLVYIFNSAFVESVLVSFERGSFLRASSPLFELIDFQSLTDGLGGLLGSWEAHLSKQEK